MNKLTHIYSHVKVNIPSAFTIYFLLKKNIYLSLWYAYVNIRKYVFPRSHMLDRDTVKC